MLELIGKELRALLQTTDDDQIIFQHQLYPLQPAHFQILNSVPAEMAFVDGGNAIICSSGNFCLSFIRVAAVSSIGKSDVHEFYVLTYSRYEQELIFYSKIFGSTLIDIHDLEISSADLKMRDNEGQITTVASMARRFAELSLATQVQANFVLLDGTLEKTYKNEEKYLRLLHNAHGALAKTSSLCTTAGQNPLVLLQKFGPPGCWQYRLAEKISFVKLHPHAKHVFRFEGNMAMLPHLVENSKDAVFLGYPYGLILADKLARVSNDEKKSLMMNFLLRKENREIVDYLHATDAHEILDRLG